MANIIWTKNALNRIHDENLTQNLVYEVITSGQQQPGRQPGTTLFRKLIGSDSISVIGKSAEGEKWIVISCWSKRSGNFKQNLTDPRYKNASFLEKILLDILKAFRL